MAVTFIPLSSERVTDRIVATLSDRLDSEVQLGALTLRAWPGLRVEGAGLVIRQRNRPDAPPLITARRFTVDTSVMGLWRRRIARLWLDGLDIEIPPERKPASDNGAGAATTNGGTTFPEAAREFVIERLETADARLAVIPSDRSKPPKVWAIHRLAMKNVSAESPMPFEATLTNAVPPGEINTSGTFGPWDREEPGRTPLRGTYAFDRADLSVFRGISGTLHSSGSFADRLNHIDVRGTSESPDFTLSVGGHPFPLATRFHTVVDGTNGDTILERVDARFLSSSIVARGKIVDTPGAHGRTVALDMTMDRARLEDLMHMAVKTARPPMIGSLKMQASFVLPPGDADVVERMRLNGRFSIANARFTSPDIQKKIEELSRRSRGREETAPRETVVSDFSGTFYLSDGRLTLPSFAFAVPGAVVKLSGHYGMKSERVDFHGDLLMQARLSETQSGIKRLLLKAVDPLFRRTGGGSSLPIQITGNRNNPSFGIDMHRVLHRGR